MIKIKKARWTELNQVLSQLKDEHLLDEQALQAWEAYKLAPYPIMTMNADSFIDQDARKLIDSFFTAYDERKPLRVGIEILLDINSKIDKFKNLFDARLYKKRINNAKKRMYDQTFGEFFKFANKNGLNTEKGYQYVQLSAALEPHKNIILNYSKITFILIEEQVELWELTICKAWLNSLKKLQIVKDVTEEHLQDLSALRQVAPTVPCKHTWQNLVQAVQHVFYAYNSKSISGCNEKISKELSELSIWAWENIAKESRCVTSVEHNRVDSLK